MYTLQWNIMHVLNRILAEHYGHKKMVSEKGIKNIIPLFKIFA